MSYKENIIQNVSYPIKTINKENEPIYNEPIKRNTIYDEVKINKPIIMPAIYDNINNFLQNLNDNNIDNINYNNENLIENNNYNNLIYGQNNNITFEKNNNNYKTYNSGNNIYSGTTIVEKLNNPSKTNMNYENNINNVPNSTFSQNNNYEKVNNYSQPKSILNNNTLMSAPFVTKVDEDNEIIYSAGNNSLESKNIEYAQIKRIKNDNNKIIYSKEDNNQIYNQNQTQNPKEIETKLLQNSNVTFGKVSTGSGSLGPNISKNINNKVVKLNNTQNISEYAHTNYKLNNNNIQNNKQVTIDQSVVRAVPAYQKNAQVRKITENGNLYLIINKINNNINNNLNHNINNNINTTIINNKKQNLPQNINIIKINGDNIDNRPIISNNKIEYTKPIQKLELSKDNEEKVEQKQIIPIDRKINIQQNNKENYAYNNKELKMSRSEFEINKNINNIQLINENINNEENEEINKNLNQTSTTPMRRPLDDYNSKSKTPINRGFHTVKINKRNQEPNYNFFRNIDWNSKFNNNLIYNNSRFDKNKSNKPKINIVKLNNTNYSNNKNFENNNAINLDNNKVSNTYYNDFNDISEIRKDQNMSTDNEQMRNDEENLNYQRKDLVFEDVNSDDTIKNNNKTKNKFNIKIKKLNNVNKDEFQDDNFDDNDLRNNDLQSDNFYLDDSNTNFSKEGKKNNNIKKNEITNSTLKRINNDGLDEFDNNFNNHDTFYNKMKKIFDE